MSKLKMMFNAAPIVLACWGMLVPAAEIRAEEAAKTTITDVALGDSGTLRGVVVDGQGKPVDGATVKIRSAKKLVGETMTNDQGQFTVAELKGGVHQIVAPQGVAMCRLWTNKAAPKAAKSSLTLVSDAAVLRGNCADGSCGVGGLFGHGGGGGLFGHGGGGGLFGHGGGYASPVVTDGGYWGNGIGSSFGDSIGSGFGYGGGVYDGGILNGGFADGGFVDGGFADGGFFNGGFADGGFVDGGFYGGGAHYCPPGTVPVYGASPSVGLGGLLGGFGGGGLLSTAAIIGGTVAISAAVANELDDDDPPSSP